MDYEEHFSSPIAKKYFYHEIKNTDTVAAVMDLYAFSTAYDNTRRTILGFQRYKVDA